MHQLIILLRSPPVIASLEPSALCDKLLQDRVKVILVPLSMRYRVINGVLDMLEQLCERRCVHATEQPLTPQGRKDHLVSVLCDEQLHAEAKM